MKDTLIDLLCYVALASFFLMLGFDIGFSAGKASERKYFEKIHEEIGIGIVTTTIGEKTTHSYVVLDDKKGND